MTQATSRHPWIALALASLLGASAMTAQAGPTWITVGERAQAVLLQVNPQARLVGASEVVVQVPELRGSRTLVTARERVYAVQLDEAVLPALSSAVHEQLHRCGGFMRHDSLAEALATLHRLDGQPKPQVAPSYTIDQQARVTPLLPQAQASNILATIEGLASFQNRMYNSSHGQQASDWLALQWKNLAAGRSDVVVSQVRHRGWPQKSVSLLIKGTGTNRAETVVLGGHLDSISPGQPETLRAPGADDDASGVASLTEIIRVLMAANYKPSRSIEFIAYAAEEVGLRGSQQIATNYKRAAKPVVGVLQLDMTAYQGDAIDLWLFTDFTNAAQNDFVADLAAAYLPLLSVGYDRCGYACSDHASWTAKGFASSFPFEASDAHYNKAIHTVNDVIATFGSQANHALKFAQLGLAYAVELGSDGSAAR